MQPKKNEKADLSKNSSLYFIIGLSSILLFTWIAIEWKTYDRSGYGYEALNVDDDDDEDVPITEQIKVPPPPPPPPPAPEIIEVVEDEEEVEETVIESTETDQEVIEDVPIYPGCERVAKSKRRQCFQEQINKHIRKNFRYPEIAQEMGIQGRVYINFIISKDGSITNIRMRGPDKNLEKEAARIIGRLPKMTPGKQRGRPVRVPFSIPITFRLQ
jgi:protein TonB